MRLATSQAFAADYLDDVVHLGSDIESVNGGGDGGIGNLDTFSTPIFDAADTAESGSRDDVLADFERPGTDKGGRDRPFLRVEMGLEDNGESIAFVVGTKIFHFGDEEDAVEELVDIDVVLGADNVTHRVAAPFLEENAVFGELLFHAVRFGIRLVDLVDGHDDGEFVLFQIFDDFFGLGAHAIVSRHDQDGDVSDREPAFAHGGKGFVSRRVDECDELFVLLHLIGADMLGDAAGFASGHVGLANRVEEGRLAVVDVAENSDDGGPWREVLTGIFLFSEELA